jgi:hypothetical protein
LAINFPDNPTVGQTFTAANRTWTYNGSAWVGDYSSTGNADTIDGIDSSQFLRSDTSDTFNGTLTLNGSLIKNDTSNNVGFLLQTDSVSGGRAYFILDSDASDGIGSGSDYVYIGTNASEFRGNVTVGTAGLAGNLLIPAGSVGIGVTNPQNLLDIANTDTNDHIKLRTQTQGEGQQAAGTGISWTWDSAVSEEWAAVRAIFPGSGNTHLTLSTKPGGGSLTERLRITDAGNVGIGTTNPTTKLQVNGTITATSYAGDGSNLTGISAGATGGGTDQVFYENDVIVNSSYTITTGKNAMTAGPIEIANGATVTIPDGSEWTIV